MTTHNADDVTNAPTGAVTSTSKPTVYQADDVTNAPAGNVAAAAEPVVTEADWAPEAKVVEPPVKKTTRKQTRASKKG